MANTKSAIKNARKNARRHVINQRVKSRLKTLSKSLAKVATGTDEAAKKTAAVAYIAALDKAVKAGTIHKNSANRHKSVCSKYLAAK